MATSILLTISIYIGSIRLLKVGFFNAKQDLKEKFYKRYTGADWGYDDKIKETMAMHNNENNDERDF